MQRFFLYPSAFSDDSVIIDDDGIVQQISKVLRMQTGDQFIALPNDGREAVVSIEKITKSIVSGSIREWRENGNEPKQRIVLVQAVPKVREKWEFVLQKATELGVTDIFPLQTERTQGREGKRERNEAILREAAEQSERGKIPVLHEMVDFSAFLSQKRNGVWFIADSYDKSAPTFRSSLSDAGSSKEVGFLIGPEGGFTEKEVEMAKKAGIKPVSLGGRILRTETAGMAMVAALVL